MRAVASDLPSVTSNVLEQSEVCPYLVPVGHRAHRRIEVSTLRNQRPVRSALKVSRDMRRPNGCGALGRQLSALVIRRQGEDQFCFGMGWQCGMRWQQ